MRTDEPTNSTNPTNPTNPTNAMAEIEIATAEKTASGDFAFRVERATMARASADPGAVVLSIKESLQ